MMKKCLLAWVGAIFVSSLVSVSAEPLPAQPPIPKDNPMTPAKIELGKQLYFDKRLSKDNTVSCNTCHNVMGSGTDNLPVSLGIKGQKGPRNSPTVWNSAFLTVQFWDGREPTLEAQAKGPMINPVEMGLTNHNEGIAKLKKIKGYQDQFKNVFGGKDPINIDNVAKAIAAYERTLITPDSPYDRYKKGDKKAMTPKQIAGMKEFQTAGCTACHNGVNFAGPPLPMGTGFFMKFPLGEGGPDIKKYKLAEDKGRFEATKDPAHKNFWRIPTLRNVALTAPYFHNGSVSDLKEVVRIMGKEQVNRELKPDQIDKIVAFLHALTGKLPKQTEPKLPK